MRSRRSVVAAAAGVAVVVLGGAAWPALAGAPVRVSSAVAVSRCGDVASRPWCDTSLAPDARAALLLAAMTTAEKVQLLGGNVQGQAPHTGATYAVDRLGIPAVYFTDGSVGIRQGSATQMPTPTGLAAAFDPAVAHDHGVVIATEAKDKGNDVVFGPTVNIARNPQGGRSYESYGEEPFLVARTAVGWIDGAQSTGVMADVKHFAGNNQEGQDGAPPFTGATGSRLLVNAQIDERTLRELYFPHFEAAVKQANAATLMCSYNMVNGTYSCQNAHDTQQVLERDWGFKGVVLSDYGAAHDTGPSLTNGLDFEPSSQFGTTQTYTPSQINAALAAGMASASDVDTHVLRLLRTLFAYNVFDRAAYTNDDGQIDKSADAATAERIEEQAVTLLQNRDAVLPLSHQVKSIAVIGPYADRLAEGGGSGGVTAFAVTTALTGIRARAGAGVTVSYVDGSDQAAAAAAAKAADVAVVVVGDVETEGQDKDCVDLNCTSDTANSNSVLFVSGGNCAQTTCPINGTNEDGLISAVAAANPKTVVVLETGAPVLTPWRNSVAAVLEAWYPGQEGGTAIARVLFGDVNPGGRLPVTFPDTAAQLPTAGNTMAYPGVGESETYSEGLLVGYRWYDAHNLTPAYPFGMGLSYTSFRYTGLTITPGTPASQDIATATVTVTNTGGRTGTAVPQLYLAKPTSTALPQPVRQLQGYQKLTLAPGAAATVRFSLNDRSFASWDITRGTTADPSGSWVIPTGCYGLSVGSSSRDLPLSAQIGQGTTCTPGGLRLDTPAPALSSLPLPAEPVVTNPAPGTVTNTTTIVPPATGTTGTGTKRRTPKGTPPRRPRGPASPVIGAPVTTTVLPRQPKRTLAFTGLGDWPVLGALGCLGAGLALRRRRRPQHPTPTT